MKKRIIMVMFTALLVGMLSACSSKDGKAEGTDAADTAEEAEADTADEEQTATVDDGKTYLKDIKAEDFVTLGDYKGVEIILADPEVTDEYLNQYIDYTLQNNPTNTPVTDRAVEAGDVANIDYEGKLDGVAFDGGTAQAFDLVIGSGSFIPGFEDGVIGMKIGETKDVAATFPDPYDRNPDLTGKEAIFTVTVNSISIQETPELTDEYVAGLGLEECKTVDDYKEYMGATLLEQEKSAYEDEKINLAIEAIAGKSTFKEVPSGMLNRMNTTLINNLTSYASMYGMDLATYVTSYYGLPAETYEQELLNQAKMTAERYIMMQAIADKESLAVTEDEMNTQLETDAASYGYENVEDYTTGMDVEAFKEYMLSRKVMDFVSQNAVVKTS